MKRFYTGCGAVAVGTQWQVKLDGRNVRTQGGLPQLVPSQPLAEAMVAEWDAQGADIDPGGFPLRDLTDYAIDVVQPDPGKVADGLLRFAEHDRGRHLTGRAGTGGGHCRFRRDDTQHADPTR